MQSADAISALQRLLLIQVYTYILVLVKEDF